jgi:sensor histidine kinase YesM
MPSSLRRGSGPAPEQDSGVTLPRRFPIRLSGYITISLLAALLALLTANECSSITNLPSSIYGIVLWGWWGLIASVLWKLGGRVPPVSSFSMKAISIHLALAPILGVVHLLSLWSLGFTPLGWQAGQTSQSTWRYLFTANRYGVEILTYGFIFGIIGIIQHQIRAQSEAMKSLELQRQLSEAQLRALQMQLEPHFLFNTLNAITTLVELGRQADAVEMLGHLNAILKSTLRRTTPEKIRLSEELETVDNYLAIEQVRFADRLRIEIKVEPSALDSLVPCFLLQPIVENAIRHGIARCESDGLVEASARRDGDVLRLNVRDSGSGLNGQSTPGSGIGLTNTRERLVHFYQNEFEIKAVPLEGGGFDVAIAIPYERG